MNIADKILRAKADLDSVYEAGVEKGRGEATDGVTVEPLEVDANGTYTAPNGVAYSPVKVNVPDVNGSYDEGYTEGKADGYEEGFEAGKAEGGSGGAPEDLNDVLTAQEEKLAELSAILDNKVDGYDSGFEDGKKSEYDAFWDAIQENGTKTDYRFAFAGRAWQNDFRPKYSICPIDAAYLFAYWNKGTLDLVKLCEELKIEIDFSQATNLESVFGSNSIITRIGVIDARKSSNINNTFSYCSMLHTIEKLILKDDGTTAFTASAFRNCYALVNLTIQGVIGQNGLDLNWSVRLSHDSLMSIINALKDYSGSGTTHTVTLGTTNLAKLTDAEKLIATQKGWTLA